MPKLAGIHYTLSEYINSPYTILLIHGAGSNRMFWSADMRRLRGYSVIAVDLPGHGESSDLPGLHKISTYADQLAGFIHQLDLTSIVLTGHSMGGTIALEIGRGDPAMVSALVLISCAARFSSASDLAGEMKLTQTYRTALMTLQQRGFSSSTSTKLIQQTMNSLSETRPGVVYGDWLACAGFDFEPYLPFVSMPSLVVVGKDDKLTPPEDSRFLVAHMPHAQLEIIPEAGHMLPLEQPHSLNKTLLDFLTSPALNSKAVNR